jgi:hypothetical protein
MTTCGLLQVGQKDIAHTYATSRIGESSDAKILTSCSTFATKSAQKSGKRSPTALEAVRFATTSFPGD